MAKRKKAARKSEERDIVFLVILALDRLFRHNKKSDPGSAFVRIYIYFLYLLSEDERLVALERVIKLSECAFGNNLSTKKDLEEFFSKIH